MSDLVDIGEGYDDEDSFIDNSEAVSLFFSAWPTFPQSQGF